MWKLLIIINVLISLPGIIVCDDDDDDAEDEKICVDANNKGGVCLLPKNCDRYIDIVNRFRKVNSHKFIMYLGASRCNDRTLFCCVNGIYPTLPEEIIISPDPKKDYVKETQNIFPANCGVEARDRVHGGNYTDIDAHKWLVSILLRKRGSTEKKSQCGGSIINRRFILTAAHCKIQTDEGNIFYARIGEWDIKTSPDCDYRLEAEGKPLKCNPKEQDIVVDRWIVHESYNPENGKKYNDIALMYLSEDINFEKRKVIAICLPLQQRDWEIVKRDYTVTGWGRTENFAPSGIKQEIKLPTIDPDQCVEDFFTKYGARIDKEIQFCVGGRRDEDSCSGDSGGPATYQDDDGVWIQAGIVSYGLNSCGTEDVPGVYVKVYKYLDWMIEHIERYM